MHFGFVSHNVNETSCSIKGRELLDLLRNCQLQNRDSAAQIQFVINIIIELGA